jgi:hypothetical protein
MWLVTTVIEAGMSDFSPNDFSWQEPDFILSYLVSSMVNLVGVQIGVTIMLKGMVITGTLVGEREYLNAISEMFTSQIQSSLRGLSKDEREAAEEAFDLTDLFEDFYPEERDDDDDEQPGITPILHMHLRDPIVLFPQPAIGFTESIVPILRIRLTSVDGWMLGRANIIPPMDSDEILH